MNNLFLIHELSFEEPSLLQQQWVASKKTNVNVKISAPGKKDQFEEMIQHLVHLFTYTNSPILNSGNIKVDLSPKEYQISGDIVSYSDTATRSTHAVIDSMRLILASRSLKEETSPLYSGEIDITISLLGAWINPPDWTFLPIQRIKVSNRKACKMPTFLERAFAPERN